MIELIHKRKWDSKVFDTGTTKLVDGIEKPIYGTKLQNGLHDIEPDGSFVDINTWFQPYAVGVSTDRVIRNRCGEVRASDTASESKDLAKVKTKNLCGVSLKLKGYRTYGPKFDDLKSTYYTTNDGITLKYYPNYKGVNIVIVINNPQTAANVYRFSIQEYGCSYTYEKIEGGIKCISSTGKDDIYIKALYVKDANDDYGVVDIDLDGVESGRQIIKKTIAPVWLGNAVGPVELDPSVTIEDGVGGGVIEDANLGSFSPDQNQGLRDFIGVQRYAVDNHMTYSAKANLTAYSGVTVISGSWEVDFFQVDNACTLDTYKILLDWNEGIGNPSSPANPGEVTWNSNLHGTSTWNTGGCQGSGTDHEATAESNYSLTATGSGQILSLTASTIQGWIDSASTNHGTITMTDDIPALKLIRARSSQAVTGNKLRFSFEYTEGNFIPFFFDAGHY